MIRSFVAVRVDPLIVEKIVGVQSELKRNLAGVRWVARGNLHFTLKFLGGIEEDKVAPIVKALERALIEVPRFQIKARGLGVFPDIRRARVLWAGLEGKPLEALARAVEDALEPLGFGREKRGFRPHLTIGRWSGFATEAGTLLGEIERRKDYAFGECWVEEVILFQSVLKPEGAVYSELGVIPLRAQ